MTKHERNKLINQAYEKLGEAYLIMDELSDEENESLENWPESLRESIRYSNAEERVQTIEDLRDRIEEIRDELEFVIAL